jgi:hypothetical protein
MIVTKGKHGTESSQNAHLVFLFVHIVNRSLRAINSSRMSSMAIAVEVMQDDV